MHRLCRLSKIRCGKGLTKSPFMQVVLSTRRFATNLSTTYSFNIPAFNNNHNIQTKIGTRNYSDIVEKKNQPKYFPFHEVLGDYEISIEKIEILEGSIGCKLPKDYREFLLKTNGGLVANYTTFPTKLSFGETDVMVYAFYGFHPDGILAIDEELEKWRAFDDIKEDFLPIAEFSFFGGNDPIFLSIRDQDFGSVYLWDSSAKDEISSLTFVADSFMNWIAICEDLERDTENPQQ
jgi:hypothetical protein